MKLRWNYMHSSNGILFWQNRKHLTYFSYLFVFVRTDGDKNKRTDMWARQLERRKMRLSALIMSYYSFAKQLLGCYVSPCPTSLPLSYWVKQSRHPPFVLLAPSSLSSSFPSASPLVLPCCFCFDEAGGGWCCMNQDVYESSVGPAEFYL